MIGNMREKRITRVYVDSTMVTTVTQEKPEFEWEDESRFPITYPMTTVKTRGFNSRITAARWLARRELQQRIVTEYNPKDAEGWNNAIVAMFPCNEYSEYPYSFSKNLSRQWITKRAKEIMEEWIA